jgi:hypothetical protein
MKNISSHPNEYLDFAGIDAAIKRAAKAAHTLARKTKTPCYVWKDGAIVNLTEGSKGKKIKVQGA